MLTFLALDLGRTVFVGGEMVRRITVAPVYKRKRRSMPRYRHRARGVDGRLSSQHNPSDIFASAGIDHNEIYLPFSPSAQFVGTMVVEILINEETS